MEFVAGAWGGDFLGVSSEGWCQENGHHVCRMKLQMSPWMEFICLLPSRCLCSQFEI